MRIVMFCSLLFIFTQLQAATMSLYIKLQGIQPRPGDLKIAVYQGNANWMQPDKAVIRTRIVRDGSNQQSISLQLEPGEYAISIVHDENDNNRMDMSWFPYPRPGEGVGVSNNVEGVGPPDYDDAHFEFKQDGQTITIKMRYYN
jgi:uncharacterized protein (DUF2141 family)